MILVGLAGWGDHDSLYEGIRPSESKLAAYSGHFPIVELDASFYGIPSERSIVKWITETPESFQFVVKAYQGMTGHQRGEIPFSSKKEMFDAFTNSLTTMVKAKKLAMVLCQFPPWFDCRKGNVDYLKYCRHGLGDLDVALEFRHQSWFTEQYKEKTLRYMETDGWIHSICDQPQAGMKSIPFVPEVTSKEKTLVRFHGRNVYGWNKPAKGQDWRDVRYLYDYSNQELTELATSIKEISSKTNNCYVIFNNNSGEHAAENGKRFVEIMGLKYKGLGPRQLGLFD
ncbi:DUF72 domain-containing protein [Evansella tamaricis]|uniref:DUF72 domain-containing protein n=1 Tax=Evansella tamaricis TaxID=2069301 RepID=A0ABS6JL17_9BACI|nr:DUF72 domain-containing protein [Evansella tamaricis]MBU9712988.1 DUF72 domain-containing protein [Evansella tamaricis]